MTFYNSEIAPITTLVGIVKWFDPERGYGFIETDGLGSDVHMHQSDLQNFGQNTVTPGSTIEFIVCQSGRGLQVREIVDIVPAIIEIAPGFRSTLQRELLPARVKWFDDKRGFGFVNVFGMEEDCFIHRTVLENAGMISADTGEAICVAVDRSRERLVAVRASIWHQA